MVVKGILRSWDSVNYKATAELVGSQKARLEDIAVARNIPSAEMVAGRYLAVQVFGGRPDPKEAVVVAVFT
ncbi:MAG: hypothetical protein AB1673_17625 [Actinomycetota bacterium]